MLRDRHVSARLADTDPHLVQGNVFSAGGEYLSETFVACPACLEDMRTDAEAGPDVPYEGAVFDIVRLLNCGHCMHRRCLLNQWRAELPECSWEDDWGTEQANPVCAVCRGVPQTTVRGTLEDVMKVVIAPMSDLLREVARPRPETPPLVEVVQTPTFGAPMRLQQMPERPATDIPSLFRRLGGMNREQAILEFDRLIDDYRASDNDSVCDLGLLLQYCVEMDRTSIPPELGGMRQEQVDNAVRLIRNFLLRGGITRRRARRPRETVQVVGEAEAPAPRESAPRRSARQRFENDDWGLTPSTFREFLGRDRESVNSRLETLRLRGGDDQEEYNDLVAYSRFLDPNSLLPEQIFAAHVARGLIEDYARNLLSMQRRRVEGGQWRW